MTFEPGRVPMDEPLAYFLTWTTYGTWLPGDERGWVEKPGQFRAPDNELEEAARRRMSEPALTLNVEDRRIVEDTIADHCRIRDWHLQALSARTEHVHVVGIGSGAGARRCHGLIQGHEEARGARGGASTGRNEDSQKVVDTGRQQAVFER